jgi:hypothetical protein
MKSDFLQTLSMDLGPVSRWFVARRLLVGISGGVVISAVLMLLLLGVRPDVWRMVGAGVFWLKQAYALAFTVIAGLSAERLARPSGDGRRWIIWLLVPFVFVLGVASLQLANVAPDSRVPMLMGQSASLCPWQVLFFAIPPLVGLVWAMRGLAPTRLREAGAVIGLAAGGAGAFIYALHCTEDAVPFLAAWYTVGILTCALLGWAVGPLLLRWR